MVSGAWTSQAHLAEKTTSLLLSFISRTLTGVLVLAVSVFLYSTFYFAFMPSEPQHQTLNFGFSPCEGADSVQRCSFPATAVTLDRKRTPLVQGQPYSISMTLTLPDSPSTESVGMFMSCANISAAGGHVVDQVCKSAVPDYRSPLLRVLDTFTFGVPLLFGWSSQEQQLGVIFFEDFYPDPHRPVETFHVSILSTVLNIKEAKLHVKAVLTGLRYVMYRHPWFSSLVGVTTNICIISGILFLSWARLSQAKNETTQRSWKSSGRSKSSATAEEESESEDGVIDEAVLNHEDENVNLVFVESVLKAVHDKTRLFMIHLRNAVVNFTSRISYKLVFLSVKILLVLALVTCSYEVLKLGTESPAHVLYATAEDLKFFIGYVTDTVSNVIGG